jgi:hypothetical protein
LSFVFYWASFIGRFLWGRFPDKQKATHLYVRLSFDNLTHGDDMGEGKGFLHPHKGRGIIGQIAKLPIGFYLPTVDCYIICYTTLKDI